MLLSVVVAKVCLQDACWIDSWVLLKSLDFITLKNQVLSQIICAPGMIRSGIFQTGHHKISAAI